MDDNMKDIRWKQRFQNFQRAYLLLEDSTSIEKPSDVERAGLIQFFEMTFELAWKLIKDFLQEQGFTVNSPKDALKQAFQSEIIKDGHVWIDALEDRNLTRDLVWASRLLMIQVLDHVIIGNNNYYSFADGGLIREFISEYEQKLNLSISP